MIDNRDHQQSLDFFLFHQKLAECSVITHNFKCSLFLVERKWKGDSKWQITTAQMQVGKTSAQPQVGVVDFFWYILDAHEAIQWWCSAFVNSCKQLWRMSKCNADHNLFIPPSFQCYPLLENVQFSNTCINILLKVSTLLCFNCLFSLFFPRLFKVGQILQRQAGPCWNHSDTDHSNSALPC